MKLYQSLKFQFIVLFSAFIVAAMSVISILSVRELSRAVEETFAEQGIFIVEKAASMINGDSFEALVRTQNDSDPFYEETRLQLRELKESSNAMYLYTMAPYQGDLWQFIIDGSAEPDDEENFSALGDIDDINDYDSSFLRAYESGKTVAGYLADQGEWGWLVSIYTPIKNSRGDVVGIIGCDFDGSYIRDLIVNKQMQQIIIGAVAMVLGLALMIFFLRRIFTPLNKFSSILHEISLGEGDLTRRTEHKNKDEIGELADYFNMTLDKIKNLIVSIKKEAGSLQESGGDLVSNMDNTAQEIHQITANIQKIQQKVTSQSASVTQTHATMEQVTENISKLDKNVEAQTLSVSKSSAAIEEMLASIQSVTKTLIRNAENVEQLTMESEMGHKSLQKVIQDIQEIARESEGLLEINAVMENISSQTNLLSMNAAIEAAHAGESGKGFAVVAGEIRKLANSSAEQSKTISAVLKRIKSAIDVITESTNAVLEKFQAIDERVRTVSEQEAIIRSAMEDQGHGSQQILQAVSTLNEQTQMVKHGSMEMLEGSKEVIHESNNLEKVTADISAGMNKMSASAEQIDTAVSYVNNISKKTQEHISMLFAEVSKFKV